LFFVSSVAISSHNNGFLPFVICHLLPKLGKFRIQLQQVILNLVVNGIDAMKDSSTENRIISIRTSRVEEFAELSVSDRGPGIPEDKLKEAFEPFFTSKTGGMGMGLSIARTIVEAHHGLIWAKNREHATQPTKSGIAVYQEERRRRPYGQPSPRCWGVAKLPADEMTVEPIVGLVRQTVRQGGASERRNGLRNHVDVLFAALLAAEELVSAICLNCSAAA
jgi:signal transduction histidine kinase